MLLQSLLSNQKVWAQKVVQVPINTPMNKLATRMEMEQGKIILQVMNIRSKGLPWVYEIVKIQLVAMYQSHHTLLT